MKLIEKIIALQSTVNSPQRIIIASVVPILSLVVGYGIMSMLDFYPLDEFDETWWMWGIVLLLIGGFEYFWFSDHSVATQDDKQGDTQADKKEPKSPSGTAIGFCSVIGCICFILSWAGMYAGGDWGDQDILYYIDRGRLGEALGTLVGASIFTIVTLIAGIIIRRHKAGMTLIVASIITIISAFFIM
jgi:hypothetical protein